MRGKDQANAKLGQTAVANPRRSFEFQNQLRGKEFSSFRYNLLLIS